MEKYFKKYIESGFTLVEMLAIVVIIGLMAGLGYADFDTLRNQLALRRATYQLAQDLRRAQEMALSNASVSGQPAPYGWGIYFDLSTPYNYILYADTRSPLGYYNNTTGDNSIPLTNDYIYQTISIAERTVDIKEFKDLSGSNLSTSQVSAEFIPPDPDTQIYDVYHIFKRNNVQIVLELKSDNTQIKCVSVNQSGLIAVNDTCPLP